MNTIKEKREKLGWTQEELANRLNVSRTAVVNFREYYCNQKPLESSVKAVFLLYPNYF